MHGARELAPAIEAVVKDRPEILEAYLFGSCGRGETAAHSDVDVAVYVDRSAVHDGAFGYDAELSAELMAALGTSRVDVIVLNKAPPLIYHRVLRDGVRIHSRNLAATTTREGRALSRYCDYVPQLRKIRAGLERRFERGEVGR